LRDKYISYKTDLEAAAKDNNIKEARSIIDQMRDVISEFRLSVKAYLGNDTEDAKAAVNASLQENEDYINSLITQARETRRDRNMEIFDLANSKADERIDFWSGNGVNMSEARAKLDEIKEKREQLLNVMNDAINSCEGIGIGKCNNTDVQEYRALKDEIRGDYKELRDIIRQSVIGHRISMALNNADRIISNAEERLNRAEERGFNVTDLKEKLDDIKSIVESARTKYNNGDYEGAIEDLKSAREEFRNLRQTAIGKRNSSNSVKRGVRR
jgi:uncharacterized protein YlxP (DUF503 family)